MHEIETYYIEIGEYNLETSECDLVLYTRYDLYVSGPNLSELINFLHPEILLLSVL